MNWRAARKNEKNYNMRNTVLKFAGISILMLAIFVSLLLTEGKIGVVFDEFPYYRSSQNHLKFAQYLEAYIYFGDVKSAFSRPIVDSYIGMQDKHPPLVKYYYAFMTWLFKGHLDYLRSVRIGVMLLFLVLCLKMRMFMEQKWIYLPDW